MPAAKNSKNYVHLFPTTTDSSARLISKKKTIHIYYTEHRRHGEGLASPQNRRRSAARRHAIARKRVQAYIKQTTCRIRATMRALLLISPLLFLLALSKACLHEHSDERYTLSSGKFCRWVGRFYAETLPLRARHAGTLVFHRWRTGLRLACCNAAFAATHTAQRASQQPIAALSPKGRFLDFMNNLYSYLRRTRAAPTHTACDDLTTLRVRSTIPWRRRHCAGDTTCLTAMPALTSPRHGAAHRS